MWKNNSSYNNARNSLPNPWANGIFPKNQFSERREGSNFHGYRSSTNDSNNYARRTNNSSHMRNNRQSDCQHRGNKSTRHNNKQFDGQERQDHANNYPRNNRQFSRQFDFQHRRNQSTPRDNRQFDIQHGRNQASPPNNRQFNIQQRQNEASNFPNNNRQFGAMRVWDNHDGGRCGNDNRGYPIPNNNRNRRQFDIQHGRNQASPPNNRQFDIQQRQNEANNFPNNNRQFGAMRVWDNYDGGRCGNDNRGYPIPNNNRNRNEYGSIRIGPSNSNDYRGRSCSSDNYRQDNRHNSTVGNERSQFNTNYAKRRKYARSKSCAPDFRAESQSAKFFVPRREYYRSPTPEIDVPSQELIINHSNDDSNFWGHSIANEDANVNRPSTSQRHMNSTSENHAVSWNAKMPTGRSMQNQQFPASSSVLSSTSKYGGVWACSDIPTYWTSQNENSQMNEDRLACASRSRAVTNKRSSWIETILENFDHRDFCNLDNSFQQLPMQPAAAGNFERSDICNLQNSFQQQQRPLQHVAADTIEGREIGALQDDFQQQPLRQLIDSHISSELTSQTRMNFSDYNLKSGELGKNLVGSFPSRNTQMLPQEKWSSLNAAMKIQLRADVDVDYKNSLGEGGEIEVRNLRDTTQNQPLMVPNSQINSRRDSVTMECEGSSNNNVGKWTPYTRALMGDINGYDEAANWEIINMPKLDAHPSVSKCQNNENVERNSRVSLYSRRSETFEFDSSLDNSETVERTLLDKLQVPSEKSLSSCQNHENANDSVSMIGTKETTCEDVAPQKLKKITSAYWERLKSPTCGIVTSTQRKSMSGQNDLPSKIMKHRLPATDEIPKLSSEKTKPGLIRVDPSHLEKKNKVEMICNDLARKDAKCVNDADCANKTLEISSMATSAPESPEDEFALASADQSKSVDSFDAARNTQGQTNTESVNLTSDFFVQSIKNIDQPKEFPVSDDVTEIVRSTSKSSDDRTARMDPQQLMISLNQLLNQPYDIVSNFDAFNISEQSECKSTNEKTYGNKCVPKCEEFDNLKSKYDFPFPIEQINNEGRKFKNFTLASTTSQSHLIPTIARPKQAKENKAPNEEPSHQLVSVYKRKFIETEAICQNININSVESPTNELERIDPKDESKQTENISKYLSHSNEVSPRFQNHRQMKNTRPNEKLDVASSASHPKTNGNKNELRGSEAKKPRLSKQQVISAVNNSRRKITTNESESCKESKSFKNTEAEQKGVTGRCSESRANSSPPMQLDYVNHENGAKTDNVDEKNKLENECKGKYCAKKTDAFSNMEQISEKSDLTSILSVLDAEQRIEVNCSDENSADVEMAVWEGTRITENSKLVERVASALEPMLLDYFNRVFQAYCQIKKRKVKYIPDIEFVICALHANFAEVCDEVLFSNTSFYVLRKFFASRRKNQSPGADLAKGIFSRIRNLVTSLKKEVCAGRTEFLQKVSELKSQIESEEFGGDGKE